MTKFKFDLGTYTEEKEGFIHFTTRFSNYCEECFETKEEAKLFAKGMCRGLSYKYKKAAICMRWDNTSYYVYNIIK